MTITPVPTTTELVSRAADLVPLLRRHAPWTEENRRLHDETIEALADAGVFKLRTPKRYGGYEADTRTLVEIASELGRGDGSASWVASVYWIPTWMAGLFPDHVQDEVFSTPDVRVCGTLSPGGMATPTEGGLVVNGRWSFISGALHSHWQEIIAIWPQPDGAPLPVMALVPMSDLQIVDDWYVSGLKGTGSVSTVATDVFVPQERVLPLPAVLTEQYASQLNADSPMFKAPMLPVAAASSLGTFIGLAKAARDAYFDKLPGRKITYTGYASAQEAPITHLKVAEAQVKLDQAEFHGFRVADQVDAKGRSGEPWKLEERARARMDVAAAAQLAKESVDILAHASGGSSIYRDAPIQRISRDIQAGNQHALIYPPTAYELYGRILCGLEPDTPYI
ncbi:MAG TPA: acyl-CoA dehydrogenase family protein [Pseudonocardiaceae bacterium]|nr:acyl-CoA dehydrogenase family protein [Pseudonocardiaceae bacterium]